MLAIRLQRRGRKGHAQFRVIVQDKRLSPKSEKVVAYVGSYDPHTKVTTLDIEKVDFYLQNGAQPSNRVAKILQAEKVKLPDWVAIDTSFQGKLKNPEKLRKNQPDEPAEAAPTSEAEAADDAEAADKKSEAKSEEKPGEKEDTAAEDDAKDEAPKDEPEATESKDDKAAEDKKADDSAKSEDTADAKEEK